MHKKAFTLRLNRDDFNFSAAQIMMVGGELEPLSGHNYHLGILLTATPDTGGLVIDFRTIKNIMRDIISRFNHKTLVPTRSQSIQVLGDTEQVIIRADNLTFSIPAAHCLLLDVVNTSCECIAEYILGLMHATLLPLAPDISYLAVELTESPGQSVTVSLST